MDDTQKARILMDRVESDLDSFVDKISSEIGIDKKWVLSEIVYVATQRVRQIKDESA